MSKIQLPKDALQRVQLGQAFAEHDIIRAEDHHRLIFVATPASIAAVDRESAKRIFVGRRGCGKTAIGYHLERTYRRVAKIEPRVFDVMSLPLEEDNFRNTRQKPFKSVACAFERALLGEIVRSWIKTNKWKYSQDFVGDALRKERGLIEDCDFDQRVLNLHQEIHEAQRNPNPKIWLRQISRADDLCEEINAIVAVNHLDLCVIIDRLDDYWDGSESAVICLMALMHACVSLSARSVAIRPYLFIRENIYRRIREIDNEFTRIEMAVEFLEWTRPKLKEMICRRLVRTLTVKPKLEETWDCFFNDTTGDTSNFITTLCQERPRDVLTFVSYALSTAIGQGHPKIELQDMADAEERFSTNKLKDLADEFDENYNNIQLVLQLFYGLSKSYSVRAIENFIQRLLSDPRVTEHCKAWLFSHSTPDRFIDLLFHIGFFGVGDASKIIFKSGAGDSATRPQLTQNSKIEIHRAFHSALHLRELFLNEITDDIILQSNGILEELPENVSFDLYQKKLKTLLDDLSCMERGRKAAGAFEEIVGDIIRLCFFRALSNVESRSRTVSGLAVRDWLASNRASDGFWEQVRQKYGATQVIWECKNYDRLKADDFHQANYYLNGGHRFLIIAFRGEPIERDFEHIKDICSKQGRMILLLGEKSLKVFLRQAMNGKAKDDHINELHDRMERLVN